MKYLLGVEPWAISSGWEAAWLKREGARRADLFGKGGVHEVGTVVFTVSATGRRASHRDMGLD